MNHLLRLFLRFRLSSYGKVHFVSVDADVEARLVVLSGGRFAPQRI